MTDYEKLVRLGTELGRWLMTGGAEIYRVEESVKRLLVAYGAEPEVFAVPNCLIVCITTPAGESITRLCRISTHGTDIELVERCNDLCRRLCIDPIPVDDALALVDQMKTHQHNPNALVLLGYGMTTTFFALFFGGGFWDCLAAALCGLAVGIVQIYGRKFIGSNLFFRSAICSALASGLALALVRLGLGQNLNAIIIGSLMVLVPGMSLTNAMREIMAGDIFSGLNRSAEVILVSTALALGSVLPLLLGQRM